MASILRLLFVCTGLLVAVSLSASAEDAVSVRFMPGRVRNAEWTSIRIARTNASDDPFFRSIQKALADYRVSESWSYVAPDAEFVEITIEQGGRKLVLASMHTKYEQDRRLVATEHGLESLNGRSRKEVLASQSERFRLNRRAFERILGLVAQRIQAAFRNAAPTANSTVERDARKDGARPSP